MSATMLNACQELTAVTMLAIPKPTCDGRGCLGRNDAADRRSRGACNVECEAVEGHGRGQIGAPYLLAHRGLPRRRVEGCSTAQQECQRQQGPGCDQPQVGDRSQRS